MTFRNTKKSLVPRTSTLTLALLGALASATGCDSRAGEEYQGEPLMTISGKVVVKNDLAPAELVPALAFLHGNEDRALLRIQDVSVTGEFPASFTVDVFEPPPEEAMFELVDEDGLVWPRMALGYVAAVSPEHPQIVEIPQVGLNIGCEAVVVGEPELGSVCWETRTHCIDHGENCYVTTERCEIDGNGDERPGTCTVIDSSGDPDLGRRLWKHFAGVSTDYMIVYLAETATSGTAPALAYNDGRPMPPGYHLIHEIAFTPEELAWHDACREQANRDAYAEYNRRHGTSYESYLDVPIEIHDLVDGEAEEIEDVLERERGCRSGRTRFVVVPEGETRDLTLEIGPDADPAGAF